MNDIELYVLEFKEQAQKAIDHFVFEMSKISTGRANPQLIKNVKVLYYDTLTNLEELATISVPEPQQLLIKPFDQSIVKDVVKTILHANLGVQPVDEGHQVRLTFPPLTTDRRKELVKSLSKYIEAAKVGVRSARQDVIKEIKKDETLSEDFQKRYVERIETEVKKKIDHIQELAKAKEQDLTNF